MVKDGYEGYNSTPSSPTKYTVNRLPNDGINGKWVVSRLCILLTAVLFTLALLTVFLCTYYLIPRKCPCDPAPAAPLENGHSLEKLQRVPTATVADEDNRTHHKTETSDVPSVSFNLTNDQLLIDILKDDDNGASLPVPTTPAVTTETDLVRVDESTDYRPTFRLPLNVKPLSYRLKILPFVEEKNLTTYGEVSIAVECLNQTDVIVLNSKELSIDREDVRVVRANPLAGGEEAIDDVKLYPDFEQLAIKLKNNLINGEVYNVTVSFRGIIRTVPNGLYGSYYVDTITKEKSWIINTLFSPTYARYAYPCFDEPLFKAKFQISIGRMMDAMTLSNTNISLSEPIRRMDGWIWDHYHETPMMSTYLTAFLIAPAKALMKNKAERPVPPEIKLWARPEGAYQTEFPMELSKDILTFFEKYFNMKFPLSKIDIVGVPTHDYEAMENWGLIIFREGTLLVGKESSVKLQQSLALMLAHEFAHQWFGNLVTPPWWNELWLKEGLSTYFQCLAVNFIKPEWLAFEEFILNEMDMAFQKDSLLTSPAVSQNVDQPNKEIFNAISYHKGSSLIRMMANFLETDTLKSGLTNYLNRFSYKTANQDDLWSSLVEGGYGYDSGMVVPLKTIMDSWTSQAGYPVVTLTRNYKDNSAVLKQRRFLLDKDKNVSEVWWIPISYTTSNERNFNDTIPKTWLPGKSEITVNNIAKEDKWVLLNLEVTGFYRVNYDERNWAMISEDFHTLPLLTKAQLISDAFNLARGGQLSYSVAFALCNGLFKEKEYIPWRAAISSFMHLRNFLIKMPAYGDFRYFLYLVSWTVYDSLLSESNDPIPWKIPTDGKSPMKEMLLENVIGMSCLLRYTHCISSAKGLFDDWKRSPDDATIIPEVVRSTVFCTAIREGTYKDWEFIYNRVHNASLQGVRLGDEQDSLVAALGCSSEQWVLTKSLRYLTQPNSGLSKEEGKVLFKSIASNNIGHWLAVSFIQAQWKQLIRIHKTPLVVYEMVYSIVSYINTPNDVKLLKNLVIDIRNYTNEDSLLLKQAVEIAEDNLVWMQKNYFYVEQWLTLFRNKYPSNGNE